MNGQLREHPLAELIREINAAGLSGALRLARERVKAVIYTQAGSVAGARSNLRAHRLIECARRARFVSDERLSAVATKTMSDADACAALAASGLGSQELAALRAAQAADVLRAPLLWTDGGWNFDPHARLAEDVRVEFAPQQLLLEAARHLPADFIAARLADPEELFSPVTEMPAHLQLQPVEAFVLSRVDAPLRLADLFALCGQSEGQTRRTVYGLALAGALVRARWSCALDGAGRTRPRAESMETSNRQAKSGATAAQRSRADADAQTAANAAAPDPRAEVAALRARVRDADLYAILGVRRDASPPEIKRAYYALAKRFHPDRFLRAVDAETHGEVENAFAQIARGYETLQNPRERAAYDAKLAAQPVARPTPPPRDASTPPPRARATSDPSGSPQYRAEESFQQGLAALERGEGAAALLYFGEAVRLAPRQARYRALYGRALMSDPRARRQAEAELMTALALDPGNASYRVTLAELYGSLGLQRRAEGELQRALSIDPAHEGARRLLERLKEKR